MPSNNAPPSLEGLTNLVEGPLPDGYILPTTSLPVLHPFDCSSSHEPLDVTCRTHNVRAVGASGRQNMVQTVRKFTTAVMAFTGLDEVSFRLVVRSPGNEWRGVVHAITEDGELECSPKVFSTAQDQDKLVSANCDFALLVCTLEDNPTLDDTRAKLVLAVRTNSDSGKLSYDAGLIPECAAPHILRAFEAVLRAPDATDSTQTNGDDFDSLSISNFPPLSRPPKIPQDQTELLKALLHSDFERRAAELPDRPALDFLHGGRHTILTYAELNAAAKNLANYIIETLGRPGKGDEGQPDILPLYLGPSPELYTSYLGVLKSGYGFCPLPLDAPEERLRDILEDLRPRAVLGSGDPDARSSALRELTWIDVARASQTRCSAPNDTAEIDESDVAYVMYTSGSTGKPKGVQIQHLACTCSIRSHAATLPLSTNPEKPSRWFQFAASTFDPSIMEIFVTWSSGATLCSAERQLTLSDLEGTVTALHATIMMTTPSVASLLRLEKLPTLQGLWTMGEALNRKVIDNFAAAGRTSSDGGFHGLANAYGPTEGSINCTLFPVNPRYRGSVIGPAIPSSSLFVLDPLSKDPRPVPAGFAGELAIGGPQVSKGYLNRPAETAVSFVESARFGRLYRTGDRARMVWNDDGTVFFEFLGRISSGQVKLNGRRAELGEIEGVLTQVSEVAEAAVAVAKPPGSQGSLQVVALLVLAADQHGSKVVKACKDRVKALLPDFMRPSHYEIVSNLPRLASAKIDRKRVAKIAEEVVLDALSRNSIPQAATVLTDPPGTGRELFSLVQRLVAEAVGTDPEHVHAATGLFSLGLDSLRSMALLQKLRDQCQSTISVAEVLQCRSAAGIAALLADKQAASAGTSTSSSVAGTARTYDSDIRLKRFGETHKADCAEYLQAVEEEIEAVYPPTATQSGMLASFVRSMSKDSPCKKYINHSVFDIRPDTDLERLQSAWDLVLRRHDVFRTVFVPVDDDLAPFAQCVLSPQSKRAQIRWRFGSLPELAGTELAQHVREELRSIEDDVCLEKPPYLLTVLTSSKQRFMVVSLFHAIFDGGSFQLLLDEVDAEYRGAAAPERTSLRKAVDLHHLADHGSTAKFWSRYLDGVSPVPFPSLTGLRPEVMVGLPQTVQIDSSVPLRRLREGAKTMGTSTLAVLQTAWIVILSNYSGSIENVVFGSVVSGRFDKELEVCMAPTFATVPVKSPVADAENTSFREIARKLALTNAESLSHLQAKIGSVTSAGGELPYDTLFAFQEFGVGGEQSGIWNSIEYPPMANDFAVMVEVWPNNEGSLRLKATFTDAHLNQQAAAIMMREFNDILDHILSNPGLHFISGSSATEPSLLSVHAASEVELQKVASDNSLLHSQLEEHARTNPDDTALVFVTSIDQTGNLPQLSWSYAELDRSACEFATQLHAHFGDLRSVYVPLCMEKSPALYVALLGILKAGGAWCPVDPFFPPRRRHDLILRTKAPMVIVDAGKAGIEEGVPSGIQIVGVDRLGNWTDSTAASLPPKKQNSGHEAVPARPEDPAYLIWTSGTTGSPKGVPIHHKAAVASMSALQRAVPRNSDGAQVRCMQFSQFTFDVFVQDLFYTWGVGGAVISSTKDIMLRSFSELATATQATHAHLTPAFAAGVERNSCPTLKVVTFIGEKLPQHVADDWRRDAIAFNTYGPAEVTVVSTLQQFGGANPNAPSSNIGYALPTIGTYVIRNDKPVFRQSVGELALSGPQLSKGYLDSPDKTADRFVWNEYLGCMLYKTGDEVRELHDGSLDFIGRVDDLVKLGGIRVELSEIEYALRGCDPCVTQIVVQYINRPDRLAKVVVAYLAAPRVKAAGDSLVVTSPEAADLARAALDTARAELPEHMIPSVFLVVREIPRTRSAKVDRDALRVAYETVDLTAWENALNPQTLDAGAGAGDWSASERFVLEKIHELTGARVEAMNRMSRLAALGVDSIGALRLAARLKSEGYSVSVADMISSNTVQGLVALVEKPSSKSQQKSAAGRLMDFHQKWEGKVREKGVEGGFQVAPALPLQESLLSESIRSPQSYWSNHFFELERTVEPARLLEAWKQVVQDNDVLRTSFFPTAEFDCVLPDDSTPSFLQIIHEEAPVDSEYINIAPSTLIYEANKRALAVAVDRQQTGFRAPLSAVTVFDDGDTRTLMITLHHAIHDGPAMQYIFSDLRRAYLKLGSISRPRWRQALSLTRFAASESPRATADFWTRELEVFSGSEGRTFPDLSCRRNTANTQPKFLDCIIDLTASVPSLQEFSRELGLGSVVSVIRAAFGCTLAEYLECSSIFFGETFSDRITRPELAKVVGPLISVAPVTVHAAGTSREIMTRQAAMVNESLKHRHVHPRTIKRIVNCQPSQPLYCAMFAYHPESSDEDDGVGKTAIWKELGELIPLTVEHPIALNVVQRGERLVCTFSSLDTLMNRDHLELFARQVDALVNAMMKSPDRPVEELADQFPRDLLSVAEPTVTEAIIKAPELSPTHWLDHWAKEHPDWVALEIASKINEKGVDSQTWTYREISAMSDRIASFLNRNGLFNRMVAVCLGRSFIAYAVVAGIWKSGNCYLPVAEDLPPQRQALLLRDSGAAMLFTDKMSMSSLPDVPTECRVMMVDSVDFTEQLQDNVSDAFTPPQSQADDNCYLLYTSGSTGTPKGVLVSRGNVSAFTEAQSDFICREVPDTRQLGGTGKYLAHASRAFDVHICEMVLAWRHGLALVTAPRAMLLDDLRLALSMLWVTHTGFVPSLLDQAGLEAHQVPKLRYLGVGGEKISQRIIDEFAASRTVALVNAYGPTEATIGITSINVTPTTNVRNIGKVVGNIRAHVFRPGTFSYVKRAQAGELCVTGDLVATGYHQRPDAKGFVDFGGERMYRTGDVVRLMADGCIEFLGRSDSQAKVRGQRLELEEVSSAVARCAGEPVDVCSLVLPSPATARPQLTTFLSRSGQRPSSKKNVAPLFVHEDYRTWAPRIVAGCKKILPPYMVPSYIIPLTFIPIQISGKADVRQLKAIYDAIPRSQLLGTKPASPESYAAAKPPPQGRLTEAESRVRHILRTVVPFQLDDVDGATNILDLGIDSLNAIDLSIKLRKAGFTCSVADVLSRPLLSQLASIPFKGGDRPEESQAGENPRRRLADLDAAFRQQNTDGRLPNASIQAVRPSLPLQESLVASSLNDESKSLYVNHIILRLSTTINLIRLRDAWLDLLADVDILRTSFAELHGAIVQLILKPRAVALPWDEFSFDNPAEAKKSFAERQKQTAASIIEKIREQPPYRICAAVPAAGNPGFLMISIHHSVYDAVSMNLILSSLYAHYQGLPSSPQGDMDNLYAHLLQHDAKAAEQSWKQYLHDFRPSHVSSNPRSDGDSLSVVELALPKKLSALSSQASRAMATLPSLLEAVLGATLAQLLDNADVTFGRVLAGRAIPVPSAETLIAPLVTTIPVRVQFNASTATLQDVVSAVHASSVASLAHQHTPLRHIQRWAGSSIPLFDVLFSFARSSSSQPPVHAEAWSEEEGSGVMAADYPLAVEVEADSSSDALIFRAGFTRAFGDATKARTLLEDFMLLLQALIEGSGPDSVRIDALRISRGDEGTLRADKQVSQWDEGIWSAEEQAMRQAVTAICGLDEKEVTKNASFFSLGVDSVSAIQFAKKLRELGLGVSSADVMKHPSIGALGDHIKHVRSISGNIDVAHLDGAATPLPANVDEADVADAYPCTPLQTSMITQTLSSTGKLYVHHHAAVLPQTIQVDRLKNAWTKVVEQTDILRTSFHTAPSSRQYIAVVHRQPQPNWNVVNGVESVAQAIGDIVARSIYPSESDFQSPPLRATLLESNEELILVLTLHHALYDGYSVPLIFHDLAEAYAGHALPIRTPFSSAARLIAAAQVRPSDFWARSLTGYHNASLPILPSSESCGRLHFAETILQSDSQTILRRCASLGVTLQTAALLAFGKVLARLVGQRDIVFGQVLAGRSLNVDGAEHIVGPLFNTVPFRLLLNAILKSNRQVVEEIQRFTADSQAHQHEALGEVTKLWRKETGDTSPRIFDALFVFLKQDAEKTETEELFRPWNRDSDFVPDDADYPMNFEFEQSTGKVVIRVSCKDAHLSRDGVSTFLHDFEETLEDILANPGRSVVAFPPGLKDLPVTNYKDEQEQPQVYDDIHPGEDLDAIRTGLAEVTQIPEEDVELGSSVYALGLDSVAAIQVVASCRQRGVELSVTDILQGATLGGIVQAVRQKKLPSVPGPGTDQVDSRPLISQEVQAAAINLLGVDQALVESVLPCLSGQTYHLAGWLNSGRTLFEPTWAFSCKFRVDSERLKDAWWSLRRRHSILRTCFAAVSSEDVVHVALKPEAVDRDATFRRTRASGDFQHSIIEEIKAIARKPSDSFTPPIRLCLLQHAESGRDAILLTLNHATYDAWTIPLLLAELAALYAGKLLEPPPEFSAFVAHVARAFHDPAQQQYWRRYLETASPTILGADRGNGTTNNPLPRQLFVMAPNTVKGVAALEQRCRTHAVALHSTVILSFARVLSRKTGAANPAIGFYQVGRSAAFPCIEALAGPTLNLLPLVVPEALSRAPADAARAVQTDLGARIAYEQASLREVLGETAGAKIFNVFVNLLWQREQTAVAQAEGEAGLALEPLRIGVPTDFAPEEPAVGKTAVDALDCGWLRKENNVFVDVGRNTETDALDLGVRYEGEALKREDVEELIREIAEEVEMVVHAL